MKHLPILKEEISYENNFVRAEEIMSSQVQKIESITSVATLH
jgi:hypothetical protein